MSNHSQQIVQKLWSYCNVLRDDGLSYGDYVEQLTCLLFLKMMHERTQEPWNQSSPIPAGYDWPSLLAKDGDALEAHYRHVLETLGKSKGMLGIIFRKAQNKIQDPAKLRRLIADLIDREQWPSLEADVKGDAYEGLLEKNAQDIKGGAGQYFTPRPLIAAIVEVVQPKPGESICDPACGTGGFLLATGIFYAQGVKANVLFFERKPASPDAWTKTLWIYDLRTNQHFTLKTNTLKRADLDEFVACYHPQSRYQRTATWSASNPTGRWRPYSYEDLMQRDKASLDIFWLKDESLESSDNLPDPDVIATEIAEDLRAALEQFETIQGDLGRN
jgi:type I restriction-modification system DNA methylase subunit